ELHLDLEDPVALAVLTAAALHVEAEAAGGVAADASLGNGREQLPNRRKQPRVRRRVRAGRSPNGALVDLDDLVDVLEPLEAIVRSDGLPRAIELARERRVEDLRDQRALAAAGDARHGHERPEGDRDVDATEVVL